MKDITAAGEVISDNARMEEEAEVLVQADIAAQEEICRAGMSLHMLCLLPTVRSHGLYHILSM